MSKYYKAFNTLKAPMTHLRNVVSSAIGKKGKVSPTIKSVKPKLKRETKMGGGMMGRRMGYSQGGKLAVTPREKQLAAQYGDKKRITRGDVITAAKKKSKSPMDKQVRQKAAFGGGADMGKVASDKTKTEVKKYEKRAKDASKFLKNKDRSFGSMMREKYMR